MFVSASKPLFCAISLQMGRLVVMLGGGGGRESTLFFLFLLGFRKLLRATEQNTNPASGGETRKCAFPWVTVPQDGEALNTILSRFLSVVGEEAFSDSCNQAQGHPWPRAPRGYQWRDSARSSSCVQLNRATLGSDFSSTPIGDK